MTIEAMKQALEALEFYYDQHGEESDATVIANLRAAIEQAQEPVAWMTFNAAGEEDDIWYDNPDGKLLEGWTYKPLYTAPRQWQGLTDEEIAEMHNEIKVRLMGTYRTEDIYRAIEAKLKEKNA